MLRFPAVKFKIINFLSVFLLKKKILEKVYAAGFLQKMKSWNLNCEHDLQMMTFLIY